VRTSTSASSTISRGLGSEDAVRAGTAAAVVAVVAAEAGAVVAARVL